MDIFEYMRQQNSSKESPLASRLRPTTLDEIVGQEHILGTDKLLYRAIKADKLSSIILYGPPGVGKTTIAKVIANTTQCEFTQVNATVAGKKDLESVVTDAKNTFEELLKLGVIPVVNENDTIATYEIEFGDNDSLSAIVAALVDADLLILLSDIDGLYTADPRKDQNAKLIPEVYELNDEIMALGGDSGSALGTGGMKTKLTAAKICTQSGCDMIIMNSLKPEDLYNIADGKAVGTRFFAEKK